MDLDDLKGPWHAQDAALERALTLNARAFQTLGGARRAISRLVAGLAIELALAIVFAVIFAGYAVDHRAESAYAWTAALLAAYMLSLGIVAAWQIVHLRRVDWTVPVAHVQRALERLRIARGRAAQFAIATGALLWAPALLLVIRMVTGVDSYQVVHTGWIVANIVVGVLLWIVAVIAARRAADRVDGMDNWLARLTAVLAGTSIRDAIAFISALDNAQGEAHA